MMGVAHRPLLVIVVLLGFLRISYSQETLKLHPQKENFDEALGNFAEGLLLFDPYKAEGLNKLTEALSLSPTTTSLVDTWLSKAHSRIISESNFSEEVSDFEKLRLYTLQCLFPIAMKNPQASYLHLKLIEVCLEIEKHNLADYLARHVKSTPNDPYTWMIKIKMATATSGGSVNCLLKKVTDSKSLEKVFTLQKYILKSYISLDDRDLQEYALKHTLQMIRNLPNWPKLATPGLCQLLNNGLLTGSDIGRGTKDQLADNFYEFPSIRYWAALSGVLMKLEHYPEAYLILKNYALKNAEKKWRVYLSLSTCAFHLGQKQQRLEYLEKAAALQSSNRYIKRALAAAYLNLKKFPEVTKIINELKPFDNDIHLKKIEFYLSLNLKKYPLAFKQAEALFNWSDPAERLIAVNASFASNAAIAYTKTKNVNLMLKRLEQARRYSPESHNLKNSSAYYMAQENQQLKLAEKLAKESLEVMPDNPSYLDTLAWIKFKKKEYNEAWEIIQNAVELDKRKSAEILMHAGDIALAKRVIFSESKARSFWNEALKKTQDDELKAEIESRLNRLKN